MTLDKGHQKSETDQHHDIDILIHGVIIGVNSGIIMHTWSYKNTKHNNDNKLNSKKSDCENPPIILMCRHELKR